MNDSPSPRNIKQALLDAILPFELSGVVLFGSRMKGREHSGSDLDMLMVARGINSRLHRRGEEIGLIKKNLPPYAYDILLYTDAEVISNFKNHNPLFLDIAEEGQVLIDYHGNLEALINETKEYIRKRGIKKLGNRWIFPVRPGVATLLSKVSNKDFAVAMLEDGKRDFIVGTKLVDEGIYDKAVYHFQQAVEKNIKSILIAAGIFEKTHFVGQILRDCINKKMFAKKWKTDLLEAADISESVEPDVSLSRYPGIIGDRLWLPFEEYEEKDARKAMKKSEKVREIAHQFTADWFSGENK